MSRKRIPVCKNLAGTNDPCRERQRGSIENDKVETPPSETVHQLSDKIQFRFGRIAILAEINRYVDVAKAILLSPRYTPEKIGEFYSFIFFKQRD